MAKANLGKSERNVFVFQKSHEQNSFSQNLQKIQSLLNNSNTPLHMALKQKE